MKIIKLLFLINIITITIQRVRKRRYRKHRKYNRPILSARKTYVDVPAILKSIQKIAEVHHHDVINFDKVSGGINSIVLPRDAPTLIVNQLPIREFRLKDIDHESMHERNNTSYNMYDRYLKEVDNKENKGLKDLEKNEKFEKKNKFHMILKTVDNKRKIKFKDLAKNEKIFLNKTRETKEYKKNKIHQRYI